MSIIKNLLKIDVENFVYFEFFTIFIWIIKKSQKLDKKRSKNNIFAWKFMLNHSCFKSSSFVSILLMILIEVILTKISSTPCFSKFSKSNRSFSNSGRVCSRGGSVWSGAGRIYKNFTKITKIT